MINEILEKLSERTDLSAEDAQTALSEIVAGKVNPAQTAAFLFGMRSKGETIEELTAFVSVMRDVSVKVSANHPHAIDMCGTGGDNSGTFNISTASMFVVAGAGIPVLKHGNRSISSKSGSYDVLEALGVAPALPKEAVESCFQETGMAFMFAPLFHPAMKHVMPARRELGLRTFFNILGPLLNPAGVKRQIIGAYQNEVAQRMITILSRLDTEFAYGVHADDGMDELSTTSASTIYQLEHGKVSESVRFTPEELDFPRVKAQDLKGGDAQVNAAIIRNILQNKASDAQKNIVLLNATFGLHASGAFQSLKEAKNAAVHALESGAAWNKLEDFAHCTTELAKP